MDNYYVYYRYGKRRWEEQIGIFGDSWTRSDVSIRDHINTHNLPWDAKITISGDQMKKLQEFESRSGTSGSTIGIQRVDAVAIALPPPEYDKSE